MSHGVAVTPSDRLDAGFAGVVADTMQALATASRVRILGQLHAGPRAVGELADAVGMEPSAASHQLRLLRHLGLVLGKREGRRVVHAYLNSWSEPTCTRGGTYVVDIRKPAQPKEAGFIPALPGSYHGEGAQVKSLRTPSFRGDLLAVNNERCADVEAGGGFDLYDVSNPRKPKTLVQGFGGPDDGSLTGDEPAHDSHSVFVWQDGRRAYLFIVDFGDLSIHEFATDPDARLAYSSYYAGGFRVFRFGPDGLRETGKFIDEGGNNTWGVEQFTSRHDRLVALSDRDYGLYIFEYTGPGGNG